MDLVEFPNSFNVDENYTDSERDHKLSGKRRSTQISRGKCRSSQHFAHHHHPGGNDKVYWQNSQEPWVSDSTGNLMECFLEICHRQEENFHRDLLEKLDAPNSQIPIFWLLVTSASLKKPVQSACIELPAGSCNSHLPVDYIPNLQVTDGKRPVDTLEIYWETECTKLSGTYFLTLLINSPQKVAHGHTPDILHRFNWFKQIILCTCPCLALHRI